MFQRANNHPTSSALAPMSRALILIGALTLSTACDTGGDEGSDEAANDEANDVVGTYTDQYGGMHMIDAETWTNEGAVYHIEEWDDAMGWLVAQNDEANEYSPGLWSRFDWVWSNDDLYYCQSVYDGASLEVALAGSANASDLLVGCGGFGWTNLTP